MNFRYLLIHVSTWATSRDAHNIEYIKDRWKSDSSKILITMNCTEKTQKQLLNYLWT